MFLFTCTRMISVVLKLWTGLRTSVSVSRKSRTKRASRRSCNFEDVAKKLIKPDPGGIGQPTNGAGIGDLQNEMWCVSWSSPGVTARK